MERLLLLLLILIPAALSAQEMLHVDNMTNLAEKREIAPQYFNSVTFQLGYSIYNNDLGKYGYNFTGEYNRHLSNFFYFLATYFYGFSNNGQDWRDTQYTVTGGMQEHILAVGFGFNALNLRGHRIYFTLASGAGYQNYTFDNGNMDAYGNFTIQKITQDGWGVAYIPSAGYGYTPAPHLEIGLNWGGYFLLRYWANSFNLRASYKF